MGEFDDPLDLLDDDGDGVIEMSLLEEEENRKKNSRKNNPGCCVLFLLLGSLCNIAGWYVVQSVRYG